MYIWQSMCYVLIPNVEYGRNLKSKIWYTVLNVEAMKEEDVEALREEAAVIIYNLPITF